MSTRSRHRSRAQRDSSLSASPIGPEEVRFNETIIRGIEMLRRCGDGLRVIEEATMGEDNDPPVDEQEIFDEIKRNAVSLESSCEEIGDSFSDLNVATVLRRKSLASIVMLAIIAEGARIGTIPPFDDISALSLEETTKKIDHIDRLYYVDRLDVFADPDADEQRAILLGALIARHGSSDPFSYDLWDTRILAQSTMVSAICAATIACAGVILDDSDEEETDLPPSVSMLVHLAEHIVSDVLEDTEYASFDDLPFVYGAGSILTEDILFESRLFDILEPDEIHRVAGSLVPTFLAARAMNDDETEDPDTIEDAASLVIRAARFIGRLCAEMNLVNDSDDEGDEEDRLFELPGSRPHPSLLN